MHIESLQLSADEFQLLHNIAQFLCGKALGYGTAVGSPIVPEGFFIVFQLFVIVLVQVPEMYGVAAHHF